METSCVLLKVCVWLVLLTSTADSQNCPSGYRFAIQPPTELNCNPVGRTLMLQCATVSTSDIVIWYWTQNVCEAGVNGTAILPGDTSDNYQVYDLGASNNRQISFTGSESTFGYYWCEISNAVSVSLRPSTITPVLQPTNMSLVPCTNALVIPNHNTNPECADEDSPTVTSRPPLPPSCVPPQLSSSVSTTPTISIDLHTSNVSILSPRSLVPSVASSARLQTLLDSTSTSIVTVSVPPTTSSPASSTVTIVVIAVVFTTLTALGLVLVLVIIWSIRRRRMTKSSAKNTTGTPHSPSNGEDDVEMMQNVAEMVQNEVYSQHKLSQMEDSYESVYY